MLTALFACSLATRVGAEPSVAVGAAAPVAVAKEAPASLVGVKARAIELLVGSGRSDERRAAIQVVDAKCDKILASAPTEITWRGRRISA